jgi:hypothetical protein
MLNDQERYEKVEAKLQWNVDNSNFCNSKSSLLRTFLSDPRILNPLYTGCKKSPPPPLLNFCINGDKLIVFRDYLYDQKKKFLVYANFYPFPQKGCKLKLLNVSPYRMTHHFKGLNKISRMAQGRGLYDDPRKVVADQSLKFFKIY